MTEPCPYCKQIMRHTPANTHYKGFWTCGKCNINAEFLGYGKKIIRIHCMVKDREFTVRLDEGKNETEITIWTITDDGFGIGETYYKFPGVKNITPDNVVERIKLIMVFS